MKGGTELLREAVKVVDVRCVIVYTDVCNIEPYNVNGTVGKN